ncbi:hypothetical protein K435DRAFT_973548 [Dendrothele bispora CBS 962.96]|uniref:RNA polymerase II-associated protein 1 C-terminal domain-containing protein n=1 Tax=Dendrothele bispora (strain CBS 962.96) TaxID=1314807 RepID=A0A4S8KRJ9_DENBC|nr:hypothetical protein K435DRAFT_973548 [Dendrothele bispora CBS 962.96]
MSNSLIGSVFERKPTALPNAPSSHLTKTKHGFPLAQHRSLNPVPRKKSAFQKAREESGRGERLEEPPRIIPIKSSLAFQPAGEDTDSEFELPHKSSWRSQISSENETRVSNMSAEERERERQEIIERFGKDVGEILRRTRERREREEAELALNKMKNMEDKTENEDGDVGMEAVEVTDEEAASSGPPTSPFKSSLSSTFPTSPSRALTSATTPSTRTSSPTPSARRLRFAELKPSNVHVYESAPPSPRKKALALPPPEEGGSDGVIKLGDIGARVRMVPQANDDDDVLKTRTEEGDKSKQETQNQPGLEPEAEEGTPEYIQKKFFPSQPRPRDVPELAWTASEPGPPVTSQPNSSSSFPQDDSRISTLPDPKLIDLRFTLTGQPIPPSLSSKLPTHLGLHHHAEGVHAGYTLDDVFLLSRSTVRMQRASMLGLMNGVVKVIRGQKSPELGPSPSTHTSSNRTKRKIEEIGNVDWERDPGLQPLLEVLRSPSIASQILKRILFTGLEAMVDKGVVGMRGLEVVWEILCGFSDVEEGEREKYQSSDREEWEEFVLDVGGIETSGSMTIRDQLIDALPLSQVLPQLVNVLEDPPDRAVDGDSSASTVDAGNSRRGDLAATTPTQNQILSILRVLVNQSNRIAEEVCRTKGLVRAVVAVFLLPTSGVSTSNAASTLSSFSSLGERIDAVNNINTLPNILALRFLTTLAQASRENARDLVQIGVPDGLLRYIFEVVETLSTFTSTSTPATADSSGSHPPINTNQVQAQIHILAEILRLYTALSRYGMYTHIAADAKEVWWKLGKWIEEFVQSVHRPQKSQAQAQTQLRYTHSHWVLVKSFTTLIESWLVAAADPHRTTPPHALVWSMVEGVGWGSWVCGALKNGISGENSGLGLGELHDEDGEKERQKAELDDLDAFDSFGALYRALGAWVEGAKINGARGGEDARKRVKDDVLGPSMMAGGVFGKVVERMKVETEICLEKTVSTRRLVKLAKLSWILSSILRVLVDVDDVGVSTLSAGQMEQLDELANGVVGLLSRGFKGSSSKIFALASRPLTMYLVWYLCLLQGSTSTETRSFSPSSASSSWLSQALSILPVLQPGDEDAAVKVLRDLLKSVGNEAQYKDVDIEVTRPFYEYEIRGQTQVKPKAADSGEKDGEQDEEEEEEEEVTIEHIAPLSPTLKSISLSTTQRLSAPPPTIDSATTVSAQAIATSDQLKSADPNPNTGPSSTGRRREWGPTGLPLGSSWVFRPVDHLLKSGNPKSLFKNLGSLPVSTPEGWNPGEVEIARAVLKIGAIKKSVVGGDLGMSMEEVVFGCMKVFMLEHEQEMENPQEGMGEEVFRDAAVERLMTELVRPFMLGERMKASSSSFNSRSKPLSNASSELTLEETSLPFLGPSNTPFYQFYTDLVGLYDAISFSHPLFGKVLIPPTSMRYAVDYRRLLWCDYPHILRSLRIPVEQVIVGSQGVKEWLWPLEKDSRMLGAYVGVLIRFGGAVEGFVRWIALHHVAGNIWEDLAEAAGESKFNENQKDRAKKLLKTVVQQGTKDIVGEILRYWQGPDDVLLPPACFTVSGQWRESRKTYLRESGIGSDGLLTLLDD